MKKTIEKFHVHYREGTADEEVLSHSFDKDIFLASIREVLLPAKPIVLDIGAHIGTFSLYVSRKRPKSKTYAIEACRDTFRILEKNIRENHLENRVQFFHLALSDADGMAHLSYSQGNWGHSITKKLSEDGEDVTSKSLGNFFKEYEISWCDLAKFNCEGAEFNIILGAPIDVLSKIGLMIILYHNDLKSPEFGDESTLIKHLNDSGFFCRVINKKQYRGWIIAKNKKVYNPKMESVKLAGIKAFRKIKTTLKWK